MLTSVDTPLTVDVSLWSKAENKYLFKWQGVTYSHPDKNLAKFVLGSDLTKGEYIIHVTVKWPGMWSYEEDLGEHHWSLKIDMGGKFYNESLDVIARYEGIKDFCPGGNARLFARQKELELEKIKSEGIYELTETEYDEDLLRATTNMYEHENYLNMAFIDAAGNIKELCDSFLMALLMKECGDDKLCGLRVLKQFR